VPLDLTLHPAEAAGALDYVERLLSRADLPTADVRERAGAFRVATVDGERVAVGGVERHGRYGLVRSVVVEPSARGEGLGAALVAALTDEAEAAGVEDLFLLTTDAVAFFAAQGFEPVARDEVPGPIRETAQFASLCPDSATVMRRVP
jgi:amino-acid N-acetyltransferase